MQADLRLYLLDISDALADLQEFTAGKSLQDYLASKTPPPRCGANLRDRWRSHLEDDSPFPGESRQD